MSDTKKRVNITLKPDAWRKGKQLAKKDRRSFSSEVETLIDREHDRVKERQAA